MPLNQRRILLTGASGGLGSALARQLAEAGAALLLTAREADALAALNLPAGADYRLLQADFGQESDVDALLTAARDFGINTLINNAGIGSFGLLERQSWTHVHCVLETNLHVPIRLCQALLPQLKAQPDGLIVNIGSMFGSLPFPGFAAYSAAKSGLRAFSQALRRELADSSVDVVYVAPRAIRTPLNSPAVDALNQALNSRYDSPEAVARQIVLAMSGRLGERHLGFPEKLFAWLNGLAPGLIDHGLRGKLPIVKAHAVSPSR